MAVITGVTIEVTAETTVGTGITVGDCDATDSTELTGEPLLAEGKTQACPQMEGVNTVKKIKQKINRFKN